MREFLCKGKRKKNGEWVTGHYQRRIHILDKIEHLIYHYEREIMSQVVQLLAEKIAEEKLRRKCIPSWQVRN